TRRAGAAAAGLPAVVPRLLPVLPRPPPRPAQAARPGRPRARAARWSSPGLSPASGPNLRHPPLIPLATMLGGALVRATPNGDRLEEDPAHRRDPGRPWPGGQRQCP